MNNDIIEIVNKLNVYRNAYYNQNISLVSDKEYDDLFDELQRMEEETGCIMSNSPTQNPGYEVKSKLEKVMHSHPMLSLDKTKKIEDVISFMNHKPNKDFFYKNILSLKLDGLTILLTYDNGHLIKAETRGNGEIGEDVTHNAKVFMNIPIEISFKGKLEVEGEAIITNKDFNKINSDLPEDKKYKNSRNLVSGSVRQLDSKIAAKRNIKFIAWKVPYIESNINFKTYTLRLGFVQKLGFDIVPNLFLQAFVSYSQDEVTDAINRLKNESNVLGLPIDGIVITYNNIEYGESLGTTGHHPKHSLAFKFYDEGEITTLRDIEWSIGKTGNLTPVAIFDPVEIDGTTVSRASVHNLSILKSLGLNIGDEIEVRKANMIIPEVVKNISFEERKERNMETKFDNIIPSKCPICGGKINVYRSNLSENISCSNFNCRGTLLKKLSHFVSREAMNIEGLSDKTLSKLIEKNLINSFKDIYKLKNHKNELLEMEGFQEKSVNNILDAIEKSKSINVENFVFSMGIPMVGMSVIKVIFRYLNAHKIELLSALNDKFDWSVIDGVGFAISNSINQYYSDNCEMFNELYSMLDFKNSNNDMISNKLENKIFVITGTLNTFKNRDEAKEKIELLGGKVSGSVSKKTSYLVNNDIESSSGKNKKAKELNIPIITEDELIKMIN